jgi:hypothetical protein
LFASPRGSSDTYATIFPEELAPVKVKQIKPGLPP